MTWFETLVIIYCSIVRMIGLIIIFLIGCKNKILDKIAII